MEFRAKSSGNQITRLLALGAASFMLANCTADDTVASRANRRHAAASPRIVATGEIAPKSEHTIRKRAVKVTHEHAAQKMASYTAVGTASWYGEDFQGRRTANGETFDMNSFSAAHPSLPLPSNVRITNLGNQRSVVVRVNDRGPFVGGRVIDVSDNTYTIELTGDTRKLDAFIQALDQGSIIETVRTGASGIGRGNRILRV